MRCSIVGRGLRTAEDVGPYGLVRYPFIARGLRTVEDAGPYKPSPPKKAKNTVFKI